MDAASAISPVIARTIIPVTNAIPDDQASVLSEMTTCYSRYVAADDDISRAPVHRLALRPALRCGQQCA
jgi:hypothetical protein